MITDMQIRAIRTEASDAGDIVMQVICDMALGDGLAGPRSAGM